MFMTSVLRMISFSLSTFNFFVPPFCFFPSFLRDFAHLSSFGLLFGDLRNGRLKTCGSGREQKNKKKIQKNGDDIPSSFPFVRRTSSSHEHTLTHTRSTRDDVFFLVFFFCSRDDEFHDDDKNDSAVRVDEASQSSRSKVGGKHNGGTFVEEE